MSGGAVTIAAPRMAGNQCGRRAGIGYEFAPGKQISLDYRFFNGPTMDNVQFHELENDIDYDYQAHNVMIGVRLGL